MAKSMNRGMFAIVAGALTMSAVVLVPGAAHAGVPADRVQASGTVGAGLEDFSSFHISARTSSDGTVSGRASFRDVAVAGGELDVDVTCLRVATDVDGEDQSTRRAAILTGPVVDATNGVGIGRVVAIAAIDGDQSTPTVEPDAINVDFSLDLPTDLTCDNSGMAVETTLTRGHITIR